MTKPLGLLVMSYGTPRNLDEVLPYYTHIRRGRAPSPEQLDDLVSRYKAIGGVSPLTEITDKQAEDLAKALNVDGGREVVLYQGIKHAAPFIEDTVSAMHADGIEEAIGMVLAPHFSHMSVGVYEREATEQAASLGGPHIQMIRSWHLEPAFIEVLASRVKDALGQCDAPGQAMVVFSAHSLPERILKTDDPYVDQLHASGQTVANQLGLKNVSFGWQSAGATGEPWLGPDILDVLRELKKAGYNEVVSCSQGFVSDHLEVLYDIDIEAQQLAQELGIHLVRTQQMNDDPQFIEALRQAVRRREAAGASA